ncbi:MAG: sigma-70 family RNA polymerase sigma factor [Clostridia bacterium]|nr:sigma-70 family RNA polymerase sigma factor [Clostridia bacterium]
MSEQGKKTEREERELLILAQSGDNRATEELLIKYASLVRGIARRYFLPGGETEDLIQEGVIGLYGAIGDYDAEGENRMSFRNFAMLCVERKIMDAVRRSKRKKSAPLNGYVSLIGSEGELPVESPEEGVIRQENAREFLRKMSRVLSDFEFRVITLYMDGASCAEICEMTGKDSKSVDNAIQRSRRKLQKELKND